MYSFGYSVLIHPVDTRCHITVNSTRYCTTRCHCPLLCFRFWKCKNSFWFWNSQFVKAEIAFMQQKRLFKLGVKAIKIWW